MTDKKTEAEKIDRQVEGSTFEAPKRECPAIVTVECKKYLRYTFSEEELKSLGLEMAQALGKANEAEDRKKAAMAGYKDEIESYQLVARTSGRKVATGFEMRDIPCIKTTDYRKGEVVIIRNDTGEMVETRKIRDSDRQMDLI